MGAGDVPPERAQEEGQVQVRQVPERLGEVGRLAA